MSRIRATDTAPEIAVRRYLHGQGLRYRLHGRSLPGKPDLVFASRRICVFVHGCFWHGCPDCVDGTRAVKSNTGYWSPKIAGNKERDARHQQALKALGWKVLTIWACEAEDERQLRKLVHKVRSVRPKGRT